MMCAVALTIGETAIYLIVVLLCCRDTAALVRSVPAPHVGRHARGRRTVERQMADRFLADWMRGEEGTVKEEWIVKEWPVWSWNCG